MRHVSTFLFSLICLFGMLIQTHGHHAVAQDGTPHKPATGAELYVLGKVLIGGNAADAAKLTNANLKKFATGLLNKDSKALIGMTDMEWYYLAESMIQNKSGFMEAMTDLDLYWVGSVFFEKDEVYLQRIKDPNLLIFAEAWYKKDAALLENIKK